MGIRRGAAIGFMICMTIGTGCRQNGPVAEPAGGLDSDSPPPVARLSDEQKSAIEAISATGAEIELDDTGFPVRIDLASERVFADEALVRAALKFPDLKGLRLAVSSVPEDVLARLTTFSRLEELFLQDAAIDDSGLSSILQAMPDLRRLTLRRLNRVTDKSLIAIAACKQIDVLALIEMNQVTGAGLERLAEMPRLRSLDLRNCGRLSAADFKRLAAFEGLVEVKLGGPAVNDEIAGALAGLPGVRSITIEDAEISADFLRRLAADAAAAERIRTLAFARCFGVTDEALERIDKFPNLETLSLRDITVTGAFLAALDKSGKELSRLTTLVATNAFLDDDAVRCLPNVAPGLVQLDLRGNPGITESSQAVFEKLKDLKELKLE